MNSNRLSYIDTAKFIAILCVVTAHTDLALREFCFSFNVPMFFICSGFVYSKKYSSCKEYLFKGGLYKLIIRIMVPYFLLSFMRCDLELSTKNIIKVMYGSTQIIQTHAQGGLWFLPTYFFTILIWNIIYISFEKHRKISLIIVVLLFAVIANYTKNDSDLKISLYNHIFYLTSYYNNLPPNQHSIGFPYNLNIVCTAFIFVYIGNLLRIYFDKISLYKNRNICIVGFIIFLFIGLLAFYINQEFTPKDYYPHIITLAYGNYGNFILFLINATACSISGICLACLINCPLTSRIGKDSFGIYLFHGLMREPFMWLLPSINIWIRNTWFGVLFNFISTWAIIPFIRHYFPFLIGEKYKK